jgi:hypothetical protein
VNDIPCPLCSGLADEEHAFQKFGRDAGNTYLPAAAGALTLARDFRPFSSRKQQLWQCPQCGAYYLYTSDYEYLANGSEDEEHLTRLTDEQAAEFLSRPVDD